MGEEIEEQQQQQLIEDIEIREENKQQEEAITETEENQSSYTWPIIRFDVPPFKTYSFYNQFRTNPSYPNNFLKPIRWYYSFSSFLFTALLLLFFYLYMKFVCDADEFV